MRKSGFVGLTHFLFFERKVNSMNTGNQFLGTERIGKLMRQYAVPCIISLLVGALYNIVDQIFIANASYLGSYGNAANTVVFPLTVVALAIAVMVGDGCCAFVSMALGRNETEKTKRSVGNAVVLSVAASLGLTAVYLIYHRAVYYYQDISRSQYRRRAESARNRVSTIGEVCLCFCPRP